MTQYASYLTSLLGGSDSKASSSAVADYAVYRKRGADQFATYKKNKLIQKTVEDFRAAVAKITTPEEFVANRRVLEFAMKAYGLGGKPEEYGLTKRAIVQDLDDAKSLANRLKDTRYSTIAKAFEFFAKGVDKLADPAFLDDLVNRYLQNGFETEIGDKNSAVRDAIVFRRQVGKIDETADILGNPVLRNVVTTALGLPKEIANQSVAKNVADINSRVDVKKFMLDPSAGDAAKKAAATLKKLEDAASLTSKTAESVDDIAGRLAALDRDYGALDAPFAAFASEATRQRTAVPAAITAARTIGKSRLAAGEAARNIANAMAEIASAAGHASAGRTAAANEAAARANNILSRLATGLGGNLYVVSGNENLAVTNQNASLFDATGKRTVSTITLTATSRVTVRQYDLSAVRTAVTNAQAAFSGSTPLATRLAAMTNALNPGAARARAVETALAADAGALTTALAAVPGYAIPLDTSGIVRAEAAMNAAKGAIDSVTSILSTMETLAKAAASPTYTGSRTADATRLADLSRDLRAAIDKADYADPVTGQTINYFRTIPNQQYNVTADGAFKIAIGSAGLATLIANFCTVIDNRTANVSSQAAASSTLNRIYQLRESAGTAWSGFAGHLASFTAAVDMDVRGRIGGAGEYARQQAALPQAMAAQEGLGRALLSLDEMDRRLAAALADVERARTALRKGSTQEAGSTTRAVAAALGRLRDLMTTAPFAGTGGRAPLVTDQPASAFSSGASTYGTIALAAGNSVDLKARNLAPVLDAVRSAIAAAGASGDDLSARLVTLRDTLGSARTKATDLRTGVAADAKALDAGLDSLLVLGSRLDKTALADGRALVEAARTGAKDMAATLTKMRDLVLKVASPTYSGSRGLDDITFRQLAGDLETQLASGVRASSSGASRNLLDAATSYDFRFFATGGTPLSVAGLGLGTDVANLVRNVKSGLVSLGSGSFGVSSALDVIGQLQEKVGEGRARLEGEARTFEAARRLDPGPIGTSPNSRGRLDGRLRELSGQWTSLVDGAAVSGTNLLKALSRGKILDSDGIADTGLLAGGDAVATMRAALDRAVAALPGASLLGATHPVRTALADAATAARQLKSDATANRDAVASRRDTYKRTHPEATAAPPTAEATEFTDKFITRYLAAVDGANGSTTGASSRYRLALDLLSGSDKKDKNSA